MTDNTLRDQARRDDVDPRSADVGVLIYGVCELAERVQTASENGTLPDSFEQRHADQIEAAALDQELQSELARFRTQILQEVSRQLPGSLQSNFQNRI